MRKIEVAFSAIWALALIAAAPASTIASTPGSGKKSSGAFEAPGAQVFCVGRNLHDSSGNAVTFEDGQEVRFTSSGICHNAIG